MPKNTSRRLCVSATKVIKKPAPEAGFFCFFFSHISLNNDEKRQLSARNDKKGIGACDFIRWDILRIAEPCAYTNSFAVNTASW